MLIGTIGLRVLVVEGQYGGHMPSWHVVRGKKVEMGKRIFVVVVVVG